MNPTDLAAALEPFLERLGLLEQDAQAELLTKQKYDAEFHAIKTESAALLEKNSRPELIYRRGVEREPNFMHVTFGTFAGKQHLERIEGLTRIIREVINSIEPEALVGMDLKRATFTIMKGDQVRAALFLMTILERAKKTLVLRDTYLDHKILRYTVELDPALQIILLADEHSNLLKSLRDELQTGHRNVQLRVAQADIHGRFVVVDEADVWQFDASFKDLGDKMSTVHRIIDPTEKQRLLGLLTDTASAAQTF